MMTTNVLEGIVPIRFAGKSFADFIDGENEVQVIIAKEAMKHGQSIFISGECGRGKTHLAVALLREWVEKRLPFSLCDPDEYVSDNRFSGERGCKPCFLPAVELFLELKSAFDNHNTSESTIISKYSIKDMLVIDDVGAEKVSDWSRQVFYTLIDRRYRSGRQTIITSNLSLSDLAQQIDVRISSRILEMGVAIQLKGTDMRAKK